jgi:hypothetical protein
MKVVGAQGNLAAPTMQSDRHPAVPSSELTAGTVSVLEADLSLRDFTGKWQVRRLVVDHLNRTRHDFAGSATITETSIVEQGELRIAENTVEASRTYQLSMDGDCVVVSFPTRQEFVRLGLVGRQFVRHHCGADTYSGRFLFRDRDCWAEFWRVSGPRKRYASLTRYRRLV